VILFEPDCWFGSTVRPASAARPAGGEPARGDQGRPTPRRGTAAGDQPAAGPAMVLPSPPSPGRQLPEPPLIADFQPGVPDLSSFPRADWAGT